MDEKDPTARARHLSTAARVFADKGFGGASLSSIAVAAGVSKQALLHHFGTKEALYAEVLEALADRLCADLDSAPGKTSAGRLTAYFESFAHRAGDGELEARLVIRALIDSDPGARRWPLRRYLDRLTDLALDTPRWTGAAREDALAGVYRFIGAAQFLAISTPTLRGMYGAKTAEHVILSNQRQVVVEITASLNAPEP